MMEIKIIVDEAEYRLKPDRIGAAHELLAWLAKNAYQLMPSPFVRMDIDGEVSLVTREYADSLKKKL